MSQKLEPFYKDEVNKVFDKFREHLHQDACSRRRVPQGTKKAAELVAAAATHTHAEQPPCEATWPTDPSRRLACQVQGSALSICVKDLMGTGNDFRCILLLAPVQRRTLLVPASHNDDPSKT